jgi:protein-tyrosine-phosphatase
MAGEKRVLFVCQHGAAKSVVAAEYLRRMAAERGIAVQAGSAGLEPDEAIPPPVVAGLAAEGFDVKERRPRALTEGLVADANLIVTFGCDVTLPDANGRERAMLRWEGVPAVSDGYEAARAEIVRRVGELVDRLA